MLLELVGRTYMQVTRSWRTMMADRDGATAIEYGVLIALLAIAIISSVGGLGDLVTSMYDMIAGRTTEVAAAAAQN